MQTFMPHPGFRLSASTLDRQRLGKQRVEVLQILRALGDPGYGWQNHPAVRMWRGHGLALVEYGKAVCDEWTSRGYKDSTKEKIVAAWSAGPSTIPPWALDPALHMSHRSNLIRKFPSWYMPQFPGTPLGLPYVWPV